jgi:hypothetical protein
LRSFLRASGRKLRQTSAVVDREFDLFERGVDVAADPLGGARLCLGGFEHCIEHLKLETELRVGELAGKVWVAQFLAAECARCDSDIAGCRFAAYPEGNEQVDGGAFGGINGAGTAGGGGHEGGGEDRGLKGERIRRSGRTPRFVRRADCEIHKVYICSHMESSESRAKSRPPRTFLTANSPTGTQ